MATAVALPITAKKDEIVDAVRTNQIVFIMGETGSGKTTQVPQYLYEDLERNGRMIGVTQPRRVAAINLATRVAQEMGKGRVGQGPVGYRVRFDQKLGPNTQIKFLTDGMLLREAILDKNLDKYSTIILDEAHERTVNSDVLLALLKGISAKRNDLKLVVMSATLDLAKFKTYFNAESIVQVEGRTHQIQVFNTKQPQMDYISATVRCVMQLVLFEEKGDILVFMPGQEEIEETQSILGEKLRFLAKHTDTLLLPLYANLPAHEQTKVFLKAPAENMRKVILSTNIAETSITIPGVRYVVDSGLVKQKAFQNTTGVDSLQVVAVSQAQATQRAGRAGREGPGKCFRIFTKDTFDGLRPVTIPEILRCNLSGVVLSLKAIGISDVSKVDFIDRPEQRSFLAAFKTLIKLGALDPETAEMSKMGSEMAILPTDPVYSRLLVTALKPEYVGVKDAISTIVAMLSVENVFYGSQSDSIIADKQKAKAIKRRRRLLNQSSDHLSLLQVFRAWDELSQNKTNFCNEHLINVKSLQKALLIKQQLVEYMDQIELRRRKQQDSGSSKRKKLHSTETAQLSSGLDEQTLKAKANVLIVQCLAEGMPLNVAVRSHGSTFKTVNGGEECSIHPSSALFGKSLAELASGTATSGNNEEQQALQEQKVLFSELVKTSKQYMRCVTNITYFTSPQHSL